MASTFPYHTSTQQPVKLSNNVVKQVFSVFISQLWHSVTKATIKCENWHCMFELRGRKKVRGNRKWVTKLCS